MEGTAPTVQTPSKKEWFSFGFLILIQMQNAFNEKAAQITLRLPAALSAGAESTAQAILTGLMVHLTSLHEEYPEYIEVLEA